MDEKLSEIAKQVSREFIPPNTLAIGETFRHIDGRLVAITKGQYMGTYGVSNFWWWREVMPDGSLGDKEECGYGYSLSKL